MRKTLIAVSVLAGFLLSASAFFAHGKDFGTYPVNKADILSVYDGDTFFITNKSCPPVLCEKIGVRVNGIDTPERKGKCLYERTKASAARFALEHALKLGRKIEVRNSDTDKYGRLLGNLYIDGKNFGDSLIERGLAVKYDGGKRREWCN